jgi:PAS domain S-box-containing protein
MLPAAANEERFRHLVDANPAITWTCDAEGRVTYVNRRLFEYTGHEPPKDASEWATHAVHPDDLARRGEAWARARAEGKPYEVEVRIRRHDGVYRWFLSRAAPVRDEDGEIVEWLGNATDIDERKRSEDNLRFLADASVALSEVRDVDATLKGIAALAVPYFADWCEVVVKEPSGSIRQLGVNHWDPGRVKRVEALDRLYPRDESSASMRVLRSGEKMFTPEVTDAMLREVAKDPEHLEMLRALGLRSFICVPMRAKSGVLGALTFATSDGRVYAEFDLQVAEELARRAAIALENAELLQALKDADRRKDEFLAVLAHELRNPLAPVRNAVEILRATQSPSPQLQWTHDVIDRQVRQMTRLVDDLLDVSRITSGKIELRRARIDLAVAIRQALETSRPLIERGGHELTLRMGTQPLFIEADLARVAQVVSNLLNNAAKYTQPGGHIWLAVQRRGDKAEIRVGDNGIGIPAAMLTRIFDMFTQGGAASDRSQGGLGIGLTLVKRLVELHGGTIEARSDGLGKGSMFIVTLPLAADGAGIAASGGATAAKEPATAPRRVLVVDDNRDAADSLSMLLSARGHEVRVAYDGLEAVGAAVAFDPDVVLMDIGLPKLDGYDAARRIREARGKDVLLVAITGWGQDEDRRRSSAAGYDFHLTKPVDPEAITRLIDDAWVQRR